MIRACHVIWGVYGFWLPNDPRGSWSEFVASWELARHGKATRGQLKSVERAELEKWRKRAVESLRYPPVRLTGVQGHAVGVGFGNAVRKSKFTILACSILPEHVHLVVRRHRFSMEQVCILLKGEATKQLHREGRHPMAAFARNGKVPSLWQEGLWKVFLEDDEHIRAAIEYVEQNPVKERKRRQQWSFVRRIESV
ncbi:MAG: hypothetical protein DWQ37_02650 [Planctomycetota bacterium]|nr:MAG: hypothetical protein DWQ37_02650 [Planctomycetota bacterium]